MSTPSSIPEGLWSGWFEYADETRHATSLTLSIVDGRLSGKGEDKLGPFDVAGTCPDGRTLRWRKRYGQGLDLGTIEVPSPEGAPVKYGPLTFPAWEVEYEGTWDGERIAGKWTLGDTQGSFALHPGPARSDDVPPAKPRTQFWMRFGRKGETQREFPVPVVRKRPLFVGKSNGNLGVGHRRFDETLAQFAVEDERLSVQALAGRVEVGGADLGTEPRILGVGDEGSVAELVFALVRVDQEEGPSGPS